MIRAILFDLDGVLVDASELHRTAFCRAVKEVAGVTIGVGLHDQLLEARPTREKLDVLTQKGLVWKQHHEAIFVRKQELTAQEIERQIRPDKSRVDLLSLLSTRGFEIGCVTNAILKSAQAMLHAANLCQFVKILVPGDSVLYGKPSPEGYLHAIIEAGVRPDECLVVEDSNLGAEAGERAGAKVLKIDAYRDLTYELIDKALSC